MNGKFLVGYKKYSFFITLLSPGFKNVYGTFVAINLPMLVFYVTTNLVNFISFLMKFLSIFLVKKL